MPDRSPRPERAVYRYRHALAWLAAVVCFAVGSYVGWNHHATAGAILWGLAALLALLPFLSHRHQQL